MVEVATPQGRVAYGPVTEADAGAVLDAMAADAPHTLRLGITDEIPWLKRQTRLTFARCGVVDPRSVEDYRAHDGYKGLDRALALTSDEILADVTTSGLRGRGGAGFPTGIKWKTVAQTSADRKFIVCNADEGDSGTFADRMIMEGDPFVVIEGMTIAGVAVGATKGYIYIRSEYPHAVEAMNAAIAAAKRAGYLGTRHMRYRETLRSRSPRRRRGLCLRRGNLAAGKPRRPPRHRPRQAAAAGTQGPVRQADRHQQRAVVRGDPLHPRGRRQGLRRLRHGPLARHDADPARRQYQAWRVVRSRLRHHARRADRRGRRRHREWPPGARGAGRRTSRRVFPPRAVRHAVRLRGLCSARRPDRPWRHRRVRRQRRHVEAGPFRDGILRHRILREMHAVPDRLDPRRRDHRQDPPRRTRGREHRRAAKISPTP